MKKLRATDPHKWKDWERLKVVYQVLLDEQVTLERLDDWLTRWSDLDKAIWEARTVLKIASYQDVTDEQSKAVFQDYVATVLNPAEAYKESLTRKLLTIKGVVETSGYGQMLRRLRADAALFRKANAPVKKEVLALEGKYWRIVGESRVVLNEHNLTVFEARPWLEHEDRNQREKAWRGTEAAWQATEAQLDDLFLKLLPLRQRLAHNAGIADYQKYRWQEMHRFDYTPQNALALHDAIEQEIVPLVHTRLQARNEERKSRLGLEQLRPWDLKVALDAHRPLKPFADAAALEARIATVFENLDVELGEQFGTLRDGYLDLAPRADKYPGSEQLSLPLTGTPYLHLNVAGTHQDILTLLHESGHAFHELASRHHLMWDDAPSEFSEFVAITMSFLATPYLEKTAGGFYTADEAARAKTWLLEWALEELPAIACADAFQHWVYTEAPNNVTAPELDAKWAELAERFGQNAPWSDVKGGRTAGWHRSGFIFTYPFYMIEYALGILGALQVWQHALTDKSSALARYKYALTLGGSRPLRDLFEAAGAKLTFDQKTVAKIASFITLHLT